MSVNFLLAVMFLLPLVVGFGLITWYIRSRTNILHVQLDGRLSELLEVTKKLAHAQGLAEGRSEGPSHPK